MSNGPIRRYRPYPWPWGQPSILATIVEDQRIRADFWLDRDLGEEDDSSDSDYVFSERASSDSGISSGDSDEGIDSEHEETTVSEAELEYITRDGKTGWPISRTLSERAIEEEEVLARQIEELVKAERDTAAVYDPDEVVSLVTQLYELFINMGHWPEGSLRYAPHTDPPVNEALALQLGYAPAAVALMHRLPYLTWSANQSQHDSVLPRSRFADYTREEDLKEGRRGYPYKYFERCPDYDAWLLPIVLPGRDGWHVMLDTELGSVRAYSTESSPPRDTVEWRRHGEVGTGREDEERASWTEYRRATLVPAAHYFEEVIYAYRSLSRLPIIGADNNNPRQPLYKSSRHAWLVAREREEHETLLTLYRECGWPDQWRRAEFLEKWTVQLEEIAARSRKAMTGEL
ncbi:hypothetical protein C8F04DRAFT_1232242 [Mycena alexandri]|uniref:Uncharacterized protein n=1 Tax=Mycena alexandri TaxID=1745969 RepID=A0AAD6T1Z3_9AGAR|nr:hypothetical protein C8F04DRAFT_1232242 [Mycena alexandri]